MIENDGILEGVRYVPSPHCDPRPEGTVIDLLVIHNISLPPGEFGNASVETFFMGKLDATQHPYFETIAHMRVSAHLFIDREGKITQFVPFHLRAWHAGESFFEGKKACNDFSIGIELEGTDVLPYEKIQYQKLGEVTGALMNAYPGITLERIVGHSEIAPTRKTDPGKSFDWGYYKRVIA